ncbi:MAG: helix-turn-helix domain-containing protein [Thermodesulfobacteriota bacterium]
MVELLTVSDVAQQLKIKEKRVHELCRTGQLGYVTVTPRQRRFRPEHVQAFVENHDSVELKKVDNTRATQAPSRSKRIASQGKGGDTQPASSSARAQDRREMRSW